MPTVITLLNRLANCLLARLSEYNWQFEYLLALYTNVIQLLCDIFYWHHQVSIQLNNLFNGIINIERSIATNITQTIILYNINSSSPSDNGLSYHKPLCDSTQSACALRRATILKFGNNFTYKMPKRRKNDHPTSEVPNHSQYDYTDSVQTFNELERLLETELNTLVCYQDFQLEASLNSFSDSTLNNHLYTIYRRKRLDSVSTMHKLVSFFIHHYKSQLEPRVKEYLDSKKLTLDQ